MTSRMRHWKPAPQKKREGHLCCEVVGRLVTSLEGEESEKEKRTYGGDGGANEPHDP